MGYFYFDDSNHSRRAGFVVGAFAYFAQDPDARIQEAIRSVGLIPRVDEYKSGARMDRYPEQARLREALYHLDARIALVVCGQDEVGRLGLEGAAALASIVRGFTPQGGTHCAFFDQGIFGSVRAGTDAFRQCDVGNVEGHFEQDSKVVLGIQVADLAAHTCSIMLLEHLGIVAKEVRAGPDSGYEPDSTHPIGFELWARTRYQWFHGPSPAIPPDGFVEIEHMTVPVDGYGLFISSGCPEPIRTAARLRFGSMYLGCIH